MLPESSRKLAEEILNKKGIPNVFKLYPGTEHGFAVRGNENDENIKNAKQSAFEESVKFFKMYLN